MATEFDTQSTTAQEVGVSPVADAAASTTTAAASSAASAGTNRGGKALSIPTAKLGQIKAEQRERGQREAMSALEAKFKAAGFGSIDDALASMAALRNGGGQQQKAQQRQADEQQQQQQAKGQQSGSRVDRREMERLQREREQFAKRYAQEQAQRRQLQRQLEAKDAEMALRETAAAKGVRDIDYALRLLQRELEGKSDEELESYDEAAFFERQRAERPYLFGITEVPANTGTGIGAAPTAPKAGQVQQQQGAAGKADARTMKSDEFQKLLRARGLNIAVG